MKILWITEFFPATSAGEITGGVEARCFYVSRYLKKRGVELEVITRPTGGETWYHASLSSIPNRILFTLKAIIKGLGTDFDLVEGSNSATYPVAALLGLLKRKPIVFWYPDVFQGSWVAKVGLVGILGNISDWILFKMPNVHYIAISQTTKRKLMSKGVSELKITVIYCGIEPKEISAIKTNGQKTTLSAVSRLVAYKHLDELIKAGQILVQKHPDLSVSIIGQGPEEQKLKNLAKRIGVAKNINFLGFVKDHKDVLGVVNKSQVFVHPSTVEGFGIALMEAAALGVAYVAARLPIVTEVTRTGQGGLLFAAGNHHDLASKIDQLLTSRKLYLTKAKQAAALAAHYSWHEAAKQTERLYRKRVQNKAIA